jgi:hypothetical protein
MKKSCRFKIDLSPTGVGPNSTKDLGTGTIQGHGPLLVEVYHEYADANPHRVPLDSCAGNAVPDHRLEQKDQRSLTAKAEEEILLNLLLSYCHTGACLEKGNNREPKPHTRHRTCAMTKTKQQVERRKHKRFQAWNGAFVALGPYSLKLGQIVNMSMGGLTFRYFGSRKPSKMKTESKIFIDNGFCLDDVPLETVSDCEAKRGPFASLVMRQSRVQFGKLTQDQRSQIEYFIHNHTASAMA